MTHPTIPRVHLASSEFPPAVRGGAGIHVYELHHHLARLTQVSVSLLGTAPGAGRSSIPLPPPARPHRTTEFGPAHSWPEIGRDMVVHTHSMTAHLAAANSGRPFVSTAHALEINRPWRAARHPDGLERAAAREQAALAKAATAICVSDAIAHDLRSHYGIDCGQVVAPGYNVDHWFLDPGTEHLPRGFVSNNRRFVLATGRISEQKGYRYLFAAMRRVQRPTRLVLRAGSPETPTDLAEFRAELAGLPERHTVCWLDAGLGRHGMRQLYSKAALHVSPAIYEPFGLANVEALLCGTPVCATAVGGTLEALRDTPAILLPPPHADEDRFIDQLAQVIETAPHDHQLREQVRSPHTRAVLARGDWRRVLPRLLTIYRKVATHA